MQALLRQLGLDPSRRCFAAPQDEGREYGNAKSVEAEEHPDPNKKGPTRVGPPCRANRPDPDGPGGLGAEESGTERTGSTHTGLFAMQGGSRLAEKRRHYDSC